MVRGKTFYYGRACERCNNSGHKGRMGPVRAACTAICAVSRSRISPTRILSGSCRKILRRAAAERQADS